MKRVGVALAAAAFWPATAQAQAQLTPADQQQMVALVNCLVANTTDLERGLVRNMLISALEQDTAPAGAYLRGILAQVGTLATTACGAPADFGAQPWGAGVPTRYVDLMINMALRDALTPLTAPPADAPPAAPTPAPAAPPAVAPPAPFVPLAP
jgi:hypothetical protein